MNHSLAAPLAHAHGTIAVVGAGIVGACTALVLQRRGLAVTLVDAQEPGHGASFGNAGLISVDSCIPISLPGMVWQVPRWLRDPDGPLVVRPAYMPKALPWLLRWLWSSRRSQVLQASAALHALHRDALQQYRELLGDAAFDRLIVRNGQLHLWSKTAAATTADRLVAEIRARQGIAVRPLDRSQIQGLVPDLAAHVQHGIAFEQHAHCVNPQRLVQTLVTQFLRAGGQQLRADVRAIERLPAQGLRLWTSAGSRDFARVVVAAGAHSRKMLARMGVRLPLESERGYHVELPAPGVRLALPFIDKEHGVAVTPMEGGLRISGTVEIAGLDHPPDPRRAAALLRMARKLFPHVQTEGARVWLGHRPSTPDSLPIIGEMAQQPGLYVACGHGHTGMTGAPMTAQLLAHLIAGLPTPLDPGPYAAARFL